MFPFFYPTWAVKKGDNIFWSNGYGIRQTFFVFILSQRKKNITPDHFIFQKCQWALVKVLATNHKTTVKHRYLDIQRTILLVLLALLSHALFSY